MLQTPGTRSSSSKSFKKNRHGSGWQRLLSSIRCSLNIHQQRGKVGGGGSQGVHGYVVGKTGRRERGRGDRSRDNMIAHSWVSCHSEGGRAMVV